MIPLTANRLDFSSVEKGRRVVKLEKANVSPLPLRKKKAYIYKSGDIPAGYDFYICFDDGSRQSLASAGKSHLLMDAKYNYLSDSDIIRISPEEGAIRVLFRKTTANNNFLLTERCNHYCLMCSQPPKNIDDSYLAKEVLETIPLIDKDTVSIGFTGGEPTLLGDSFFQIVESCKNNLPGTYVHVLTNGRLFKDHDFAARYASIKHPDITLGIPIYSDVSHIHDYVVQSDNAFDETIRGILNLKANRQRVEIRVVVHKQTYQRLPQLATFLTRNLAFVDHVALMGLEITGFTKANMKDLWIDPVDYQKELKEAVEILAFARMNVSIYNHQLCTLPKEIWHFSRSAISDWKNEYMPVCEGCSVKDKCGGFFSTQLLHPSKFIKPI